MSVSPTLVSASRLDQRQGAPVVAPATHRPIEARHAPWKFWFRYSNQIGIARHQGAIARRCPNRHITSHDELCRNSLQDTREEFSCNHGLTAGLKKGIDMLDRRRPQGLRLEIDLEAETLTSNSAVDAFSIASRRAQEASSEQMERDWSGVAATIARRTGRRTLTSTRPRSLALI